MAWTFNDDAGLWIGPDGWTYNPETNQFKQNNQDYETADVPINVRESLEATAQGLIEGILTLAGAERQDFGGEIPIDIQFEQNNEITAREVLEPDVTFGSFGAAPCLIVFAVGDIDDGDQQVAVGAHLDDAVYLAPDEIVEEILTTIDLGGEKPVFYVFGGEVGGNINPNPDGGNMDYSRYYMFFKAIADKYVCISKYNFPSNGNGGQSTSAALRAENFVRVWH